MPLARPLMWANLKYNALWAPALENKNVRAWYDEFEAKMVQAREEIQAFDDPAFWKPRLLRAKPDEPDLSP